MPRSRLPVLLLLLIAPTWLVFRMAPVRGPALTGQVRDAHGPMAGAVVRFQGNSRSVLSGAGGWFELPIQASRLDRLTAWKEGYFIGSARPTTSLLSLTLEPLPPEDNEDYAWVDPTPNSNREQNCGNCHREIHREWSASGHARSAMNRRFLNLYDGSDWQGRHGVGWSLLTDHPDGAGVCTACHAPTVNFSDPAYYDLRLVRDVAAQGVHCDYCHKIADAGTGKIGWTHGRFGLKLLRPAVGQLFFGPLDDVDRGEDAYYPLYRDSRYCASCHEGVVFGVHVYSTYSEWLESPARGEGKQCQSCHMTPTGDFTNIAPGKGGIERDPRTLGNHRFFAGSQAEMLRRALKLSLSLERHPDGVRVVVELSPENVGHRVPTGFIDRNLVLVVEGYRDGKPVLAEHGPVLPEAAGKEFAGRSGLLFAKRLRDFDGRSPSPFWNAPKEVMDTRLVPGRVERSEFGFPGEVDEVRVRLIYRRFWPEVVRTKGWPDESIVVLERRLTIPSSR